MFKCSFCQLILLAVFLLDSTNGRNVKSAKNNHRNRLLNSGSKVYEIVNQKCEEYSKARYVNTELDCVLTIPLVKGGRSALSKEFPHMALLGSIDHSKKITWFCCGSLISDQYVLTAAHCLTQFVKLKSIVVRLGELDISTNEDEAEYEDFGISEYIQHPHYNPQNSNHDIMLLKLNKRVTFSPHIRPICLYNGQIKKECYETKLIISGWGTTGGVEMQSSILRTANVNLLSNKMCNIDDKTDSEIKICAGDPTNEGTRRDTCGGDSGGPLQFLIPGKYCLYMQVGITSRGYLNCGEKDTGANYTNIEAYISWIQSNVWPSSSKNIH